MSNHNFETDFIKKMNFYAVSQLRVNEDYKNFCEIIGKCFNDLKKVSSYLLNSKDIDTASGIWLDYIGWLVGTTREVFDISQFFSVNSPDLNVEKYIWFPGQTVGSATNLKDDLFRRKIYAKIGYNISKGTRNENNYIIKNMTFADRIKIRRYAPMQLDIYLQGNNIIMTPTFRQDIEKVLGQGVGIHELVVNNN